MLASIAMFITLSIGWHAPDQIECLIFTCDQGGKSLADLYPPIEIPRI